MPLTRLLTAAALSAALAAPAFAQHPANRPTDGTSIVTPPPSATTSGTPASATVVDPTAPAVILQDSPTPPEDAWKLKAGDPNVITNGPVPDTPENRARYGGPISNGGRRTAPVGN